MSIQFVAVVAYVVSQLLVCVWISRRIRNEDDFLLAGRRLGYSLGTFTIFATWFGAETCIGAAGHIYEHGLAGASGEPFGYAICLALMGLIFAVPLWKRKIMTLADLFRERFSSTVEKFTVFIVLPSSVLWTAIQMRAFGEVLTSISSVDFFTMITIASFVLIAYTMLGGILADAVTDLIQGIALIIGIGLTFFAVVKGAGGPAKVFSLVEPDRWNMITGGHFSLLERLESWAVPILGAVVEFELVMRILAMRSPTVAKRSSLAAGGLYLVVGLLPALIGLVGFYLIPNLEHPEQILLVLAQKHLGSVMYIVFMGALVSAILSTADSTLLSASSLLSHNLVIPLLKNPNDKKKLLVSRLGVVFLGIVAYVLALKAQSIHQIIQLSLANGSSGLLTIVIFGLFTRFGNTASALASLVVGCTTYLVLSYVAKDFPAPYLCALALSFFSYTLVGAAELLVKRRTALKLVVVSGK